MDKTCARFFNQLYNFFMYAALLNLATMMSREPDRQKDTQTDREKEKCGPNRKLPPQPKSDLEIVLSF